MQESTYECCEKKSPIFLKYDVFNYKIENENKKLDIQRLFFSLYI